jgi:hypothetical protein
MPFLQSMWSRLTQEHQVLGLMLFFGLLLGTIFIYVVPPWQHYDEPTHFEYAWLIANRNGFPSWGEYDQPMRREVAASMVEHGFFKGMGFTPNLISSTEPVWIGISQAGSSPLYYWVASLPIRILRTSDITFQLIVLRYVSLLFYLVTIAAAYGIAVELTPPKHSLRWLLPTTILLLPGFVDILTAVNDDVGATAFFSLFIWFGIKLINRGFRWFRFVTFVLLAVFCFYTKNTVMIAVILAPIPIIFSFIHGKQRRYVWFASIGGFILLVISLFGWGAPANWYRRSLPSYTIRALNQKAPDGKYVFEFSMSHEFPNAQIMQLLPGHGEGNSVYTIGAWIWADQAVTVQTPALQANGGTIVKEVEVNEQPKFFFVSGSINTTDSPLKLIVSPTNKQLGKPLTVYYDGLVVVKGTWPEDSSPAFNDSSVDKGVWGNKEFINMVRNPSAEIGRLRFRSWVETIITARYPGNPSLTLGLILDPTSIYSYYTATIKSLLQTFWAKFGWAHVVLKGYRPYTILAVFTLTGFIGALVAFWWKRFNVRWDVFLFLGLALITIWGAALLRGLTSILDDRSFIPVARYAYPVIIPTMLILDVGWLQVIDWTESYFKLPKKFLLPLLVLFFIFLDILSIYSITWYYMQ